MSLPDGNGHKFSITIFVVNFLVQYNKGDFQKGLEAGVRIIRVTNMIY